jgi:hypothetical protein
MIGVDHWLVEGDLCLGGDPLWVGLALLDLLPTGERDTDLSRERETDLSRGE